VTELARDKAHREGRKRGAGKTPKRKPVGKKKAVDNDKQCRPKKPEWKKNEQTYEGGWEDLGVGSAMRSG